jgi:hypothetical protein
MAAYGAAWGLLLGMIFGMLYPHLEHSLNRANPAGLQLPPFDFIILMGFGWIVGGAIGCVWGLAVGLVESLALIVVELAFWRSRIPHARHALLLAVVCGTLAAVTHMMLSAFIAPSYPTFAHWLVNVGLPVLIMSIVFGLIAYSVGKRYVEANAAYAMIGYARQGHTEKRTDLT